MSKRTLALKKSLMLMSMGGSTFAFGLSNATCISNEALTTFYQGTGNAAIETFFDPAGQIGGDFDAVVVQPTTQFVQDWWSQWVLRRIPQDPSFSLLRE